MVGVWGGRWRIGEGRRRSRGRLVALSVVSVGGLLLSACGGGGPGAAAPGHVTRSSGQGSTGNVASWCGSKPITLGYLDGNGANAWSQESLAQAKKAAAECPAVKKVMVVDADFNVQAAVSGLDSLVARGANAIVIVPDASASAELPGIIAATRHGVKVVPWAVNPGGSVPQDYVTFVNYVTEHNGALWAQWLVSTLHGKGNIVYLGGPPGNPIDVAQLTGVVSVLKKYPNMKLLTGYSTSTWPVTNWAASTAQQVMAGLLAKYSGTKIDGLITGDGQSTLGAIQAFKDANRPTPDIAGQESNGLACAWQSAKGTSDAFQLATSSNRNWMAQVAVQKAIAAANGLTAKFDGKPVPSTFNLPLYENSVAGGALTPHCDRQLPMADLTSSILKPLSFWLSTAVGK